MWIPLAILTALTSSLTSPINKYQLRVINPISLLFINQLFIIFFMYLLVMCLGGIPHVTSKFLLLMICASLLDLIAFICSYRAIEKSDISILAPLSSFTPVFATLFGAIFLFEIPSPLKLIGVLTIVVGVYFLNISQISGGLFKPIQKLMTDKGVRLYFITVMLFGLTPIFQKQAIFEITPSMPIFASFAGNSLVTLYLFIFFFIVKRVKIGRTIKIENFGLFVIIGILSTFGQYAAYKVFSMTHVGYATAIFSTSSLFAIILGGLLFSERNIRERLLGAGIMIAGVLMIAI